MQAIIDTRLLLMVFARRFTGTETRCLNLGSYNYLGFAQNEGPCADEAEESIKAYGLAACSSRREIGNVTTYSTRQQIIARAVALIS